MIGYVLEMDASETVDPDDRHYVFDSRLPENPEMLLYVYEIREVEVAHQFFTALVRSTAKDEQAKLLVAFDAGKPVYSSGR